MIDIDIGNEVSSERERSRDEVTPAPPESAEAVEQQLIRWRSPAVVVTAARLVVALEAGTLSADATPESAALLLAMRAVAWRRRLGVAGADVEAPTPPQCSALLRDLFREVYRDIPAQHLILLLFAFHAHRLRGKTATPRPVALLTEGVFIPLAQMLGVWSLRRDWLEKCMASLHPPEYERMLSRLGDQDCPEGLLRSLRPRWRRLWEAADGAFPRGRVPDRGSSFWEGGGSLAVGVEGPAPWESQNPGAETPDGCLAEFRRNPWLAIKATAYFLLEDELDALFRAEGFSVDPRRDPILGEGREVPAQGSQTPPAAPVIYPIPIFPGVSVRRVQFGESPDRVAQWLRFRILCEKEEDCYRVLGLVHRLGNPWSYKFSEYFADYLASPKPNGYRAIHTAIHYRGPNQGQRTLAQPVPVELRIMTPRCHLVNELGFIAAVHKRKMKDRAAWKFWWDRGNIARLRELVLRQEPGSKAEAEALKEASPEAAGPKSDASMIWAFTPLGEVFGLPQNSTALDFAYRVHSELGNRARRIDVNGRAALYGTPLQDGDLVEVHYDPHFEGPDLGWTGSVTTKWALQKIQQGLMEKARWLHPGRAEIEKILVRRLRAYGERRGHEFRISSHRLETLLRVVATARMCETVLAMYEDIEQGRLKADVVISDLISAELTPLLRHADQKAIDRSFGRLRLCRICRPVPGDSVVGIRKRKRGGEWVVHREDASGCAADWGAGQRCPLSWWEEGGFEKRIDLEILGGYRPALLETILRAVSAHDRLRVEKVEAEMGSDSEMKIHLALESECPDSTLALHEDLERMEGVWSVSVLRSSPADRASASARSRPTNPYDTGDDLDRSMFYGREDELEQMLAWLRDDAELPGVPLQDAAKRSRRLMLLGPHRVGKTCLANYFSHSIVEPQRLATWVYIDFRGLTGFDAQSVATFIKEKIPKTALPERDIDSSETPLEGLCRHIRHTIVQLGGRRLLIALDEINYFLDVPREACSPTVIDNLHYLITSLPEVHWLLITQPIRNDKDPRVARLSHLLVKFAVLEVPHLPPTEAVKLIKEPASRCGVHFAGVVDEVTGTLDRDYIPRAILEHTDGNPYLIQVYCRRLFDRVTEAGRSQVNEGDFERVSSQFLEYKVESNFYPAVAGLTSPQTTLLVLIAEAEPSGVFIRELEAELRRSEPQTGEAEFATSLHLLEKLRLVAVSEEKGEEKKVRIPVGLFRLWVREHFVPEYNI